MKVKLILLAAVSGLFLSACGHLLEKPQHQTWDEYLLKPGNTKQLQQSKD